MSQPKRHSEEIEHPCQCLCMYSFFHYYAHNCGEIPREHFRGFFGRGPSCLNNKLQLHVMIMTSSPTLVKETTRQEWRGYVLTQKHTWRIRRAGQKHFSVLLNRWLFSVLCARKPVTAENQQRKQKGVFFGLLPNNTGESRDYLLTNKVPFSETWQLHAHTPSFPYDFTQSITCRHSLQHPRRNLMLHACY